MRDTNKTDRVLVWMVCAAIAAGLLLCAGMWLRRDALGREVRQVSAEAETVFGEMNAISDEKEGLQAELKEVRSAIREAELTREESEAKAEEIRAQLPALQAEKEALTAWERAGAGQDPAALAGRMAGETWNLNVAREALRLQLEREDASGIGTGAEKARSAAEALNGSLLEALPLLIARERAAAPLADEAAEQARQERISAWEEALR